MLDAERASLSCLVLGAGKAGMLAGSGQGRAGAASYMQASVCFHRYSSCALVTLARSCLLIERSTFRASPLCSYHAKL